MGPIFESREKVVHIESSTPKVKICTDGYIERAIADLISIS
jgi:hypothetical protein